MYEVNDRIFTKKFIDILTYAIEQDYIDIDNESTIRIDVFNDIKINDIEIPYNNFTDLTLDDLASIVVKFSYSPKAANKILEIKINTTI